MVKIKRYHWIGLITTIVILGNLYACLPERTNIKDSQAIDRKPEIYPDYNGITIPLNIAPLNFYIKEQGRSFLVWIHAKYGNPIIVKDRSGNVSIPVKQWKVLLQQNAGQDLFLDVYCEDDNGKWFKFNSITNIISMDEIDPYLAYRLIEPGYILWGNIGIYQRNLENFHEEPIIQNKVTNGSCMNCHSFNNQNPENMLFHLRAGPSGTMIIRNGEIKMVNTKIEQTISAGVYPSWHPNGNLVAFSVNKIGQYFHAVSGKSKEVLDFASDIVVYNIDANTITSTPKILSKDKMETFPCWSPNGKYLYYCSAPVMDSIQPAHIQLTNQFHYDQIKYNLLRISFDETTNTWGDPEMLVSSAQTLNSVTLPRVSPHNRYVMFCMSDYGTFSINHSSSDLYLYDLKKDTFCKMEINSDDTDSFHSWSSNGRWFVFSSKREDGVFTRPYICYFGNEGETGKPFIMSQDDPKFYGSFLKSYNVPEFIKGKVNVSAWELSNVAKKTAVNATLDPNIDIDAFTGETVKISIQ